MPENYQDFMLFKNNGCYFVFIYVFFCYTNLGTIVGLNRCKCRRHWKMFLLNIVARMVTLVVF